MSSSTRYTFSKTRLIVHVVLLLLTAGAWLPFGGLWELYRFFKN